MELTQIQLDQLKLFIIRKKFLADENYVGFLSGDVVDDPEAAINYIAERLIESGKFTKESFLQLMERQLVQFQMADTEDREQAGEAVEQMMDILGIESSDGRLPAVVYGLPASQFKNMKN